MSKSINLYATIEDLQGIISQISYKGIILGFCYARFYKTEEIKEIINFSEIEEKTTIFIFEKNGKVPIRTSLQRNGDFVYLPDTSKIFGVSLNIGGYIVNTGILLPSQLSSIGDNEFSLSLFKDMFKEIKLKFKKIKSFYIGKNAEILFDSGTRLTVTEKSPKEYDLSRN